MVRSAISPNRVIYETASSSSRYWLESAEVASLILAWSFSYTSDHGHFWNSTQHNRETNVCKNPLLCCWHQSKSTLPSQSERRGMQPRFKTTVIPHTQKELKKTRRIWCEGCWCHLIWNFIFRNWSQNKCCRLSNDEVQGSKSASSLMRWTHHPPGTSFVLAQDEL